MTRTQVHVALALLRKVLPDLASVELNGNPDKPLMVQVVRFSDGEQLSEPRPVLDMGKLIEMDRVETVEIEAEARRNGHGDGTKDGLAIETPVKAAETLDVSRMPSPQKSYRPKLAAADRKAIKARAAAGRKQ